jgi:hypothetical protein
MIEGPFSSDVQNGRRNRGRNCENPGEKREEHSDESARAQTMFGGQHFRTLSFVKDDFACSEEHCSPARGIVSISM